MQSPPCLCGPPPLSLLGSGVSSLTRGGFGLSVQVLWAVQWTSSSCLSDGDWMLSSQSQSYLMIDSQLARLILVLITCLGPQDQIFITVRQLRVYWYGAPSLMRGCVIYNCCWSSPAQSLSPAGLMTIFYSLRSETPPNWRARSLYLYPQGTE
jgi:hypothetical protein